MIPVIFINCSSVPFIHLIMNGSKLYETRSRNTLRSFVGKRVLLAMTGKGKPLVMCSAIISQSFRLDSVYEWNAFRPDTCVPLNSTYDWNGSTKHKWLYELSDVRPFSVPFHPDGIRHGRTWLELDKIYFDSLD